MNDLLIDNDSNSSNSDNFMLIILFMCFIFLIAILNATTNKIKNNSKILRKSVKVLIITSLIIKSLIQFITELIYLLKRRSLNWMS